MSTHEHTYTCAFKLSLQEAGGVVLTRTHSKSAHDRLSVERKTIERPAEGCLVNSHFDLVRSVRTHTHSRWMVFELKTINKRPILKSRDHCCAQSARRLETAHTQHVHVAEDSLYELESSYL